MNQPKWISSAEFIPQKSAEVLYAFLRGCDFMARTGMLRAINGFDQLLAYFGLLLVSVFAAIHIYSASYSHAALHEFWRSPSSSAYVPVEPFRGNSGIPDFGLWSEKWIEAYQTSLVSNFLFLSSIFEISSIGLEVPVFQGIARRILICPPRGGVGTSLGSSSPYEHVHSVNEGKFNHDQAKTELQTSRENCKKQHRHSVLCSSFAG
jgi:hypothetical protein